MLPAFKSTAEEKTAAVKRKENLLRTEKEKALQERMALSAKLRTLRLAKEAADIKVAEKVAAEKARDKKKKTKKPR